MANRLSVKDILAAARAGGAAKPATADDDAAPVLEEIVAAPDVAESEELPTAPRAVAASAAPLGRPLTLKEKLAAARAGGSAAPAPAATAPVAAKVVVSAPRAEVEAAPAEKAVPAPTAESLGRPLTLKEKLAAARGGAASSPVASAVGAKPAVTAKPIAAKSTAARVLPPLDKITDTKDLAEALRQAGAQKTKDIAAATAATKAAEAGATPAAAKAAGKATAKSDPKVKAVPPKPSKSAATAEGEMPRRVFLELPIIAWVVIGWSSFIAASTAATVMSVRFLFPNVLAEPPSTIKVGVATQFDPNEVNERWKAEWGFWIVRATYEGQDQIYALQSVCTHLGCPPNWLVGEQKFKCPCHGSGFYISGINFEGPAPRPLQRFKISTGDDGQLVVDKSAFFQQELGQWSDPDSFIPV